MDIGIGGDGGTHIDSDGRRIDQFDMRYAWGRDAAHMGRERPVFGQGGERRDQTFKNQRGFPGTGNAGHNREPPFRDLCFQGPDRVKGGGGQSNRPLGEDLLPGSGRSREAGRFREKRPDYRSGIPD